MGRDQFPKSIKSTHPPDYKQGRDPSLYHIDIFLTLVEVFEDKWLYGRGGVVEEGGQLASNFCYVQLLGASEKVWGDMYTMYSVAPF